MYCINCGNEVEANAKFCRSCGQPLSKNIFCSSCGTSNVSNAELCSKCGTRLVKVPGVAKPPAAPSPQESSTSPRATPPSAKNTISVPASPQKASQSAKSVKLNAEQPDGDKARKDTPAKSPKSKIAAAVLALLFGQLGFHRLYTGKKKTAIFLLILTIAGYITVIFTLYGFVVLGVVGLWILIDFILITSGRLKDGNGLLIK